MIINSDSLLTMHDAGTNFRYVSDLTTEYGIVYIFKNHKLDLCIVSAVKYPWNDKPASIPDISVSVASQHFNKMLDSVRRFGIVTLTKRQTEMYYVIDIDFMKNYLHKANTEAGQIQEFYSNFTSIDRSVKHIISAIEESVHEDCTF